MKADKNRIKELVADVLEINVSEIGDDSEFVTDLAMNSLQMLDCVAEIEDEYDIRIPRAAIRGLTSESRVTEYIEEL